MIQKRHRHSWEDNVKTGFSENVHERMFHENLSSYSEYICRNEIMHLEKVDVEWMWIKLTRVEF